MIVGPLLPALESMNAEMFRLQKSVATGKNSATAA
jgi:hypothetical protein